MPRAALLRIALSTSCAALGVGCAAQKPAHAKAAVKPASSAAPSSGDPCHRGATTEQARRCLDRAEALQHSGGSGAAQLAAKVCGGHLDSRDRARCFNLGVMVQ